MRGMRSSGRGKDEREKKNEGRRGEESREKDKDERNHHLLTVRLWIQCGDGELT